MENLNIALIYALIGISLVTIIDINGSILSRKLNFSYGYFSILSFVVYISMAYLVMKKTDLYLPTMICSLLIGFYDGYVGWKLSKKFNANYGKKNAAQLEKITTQHAVFAGVMVAIVCGWIGIFLARS